MPDSQEPDQINPELWIRILTRVGRMTPERAEELLRTAQAKPGVDFRELLFDEELTEDEIKSLRLAQYLLNAGKVTELEIMSNLSP